MTVCAVKVTDSRIEMAADGMLSNNYDAVNKEEKKIFLLKMDDRTIYARAGDGCLMRWFDRRLSYEVTRNTLTDCSEKDLVGEIEELVLDAVKINSHISDGNLDVLIASQKHKCCYAISPHRTF